LKEFARAETIQGRWNGIDNIRRAFHGSARVEIVDDRWLPVLPTYLYPTGSYDDLSRSVSENDLRRLKEIIAQRRLSQDELDDALMESSGYLDDGCFVEQLIAAGANPNNKNTDSDTPLQYAARFGNLHAARVLLAAGADADVRNSRGETALDLARKGKYRTMELLLMSKSGRE
jgi:ankyrin repeat protein